MKFKLIAASAAVLVMSMNSAAFASIGNGDFETGTLPPWTAVGSASVVTTGYGSSAVGGGAFQGLVSNATNIGEGAIEAALGLSAGDLDALAATGGGAANATVGSAMHQTITAFTGNILTFDWNFLTNEGTPSATFDDFGFWSITDGTGAVLLSDTFGQPGGSTFSASATPFSEETGFSTASYTFGANGTYILGFGVMDAGDTVVNSGLLVDNVSLNSIPEPGSVMIWAAFVGLGFVGAGRRRRK